MLLYCHCTAVYCRCTAAAAVVQFCVETMMHLTCTNMPVEQIDNALTEVSRGQGWYSQLENACRPLQTHTHITELIL